LRDAILHSLPPAPRSKNKEISPGLEAVILKCLQKDPKLRYQSANELLEDLIELARGSGSHRAVGVPPKPGWLSRPRRAAAIIFGVLLLMVAGVVLWRNFAVQVVPLRMSVIVAEFENRTGDPVFDQAPRELISTALSEAPQVSVFPSSRLPDVLKRMQKPETVPVDEKVGREICTREGLQSVVSGSISKLGSSYLVLVRVLGCNGDLIVTTEKRFSSPEQLPPTMDEIVATIRHKWGESKGAIQQDSQPLATVTSGSLEALKLYSSGKQQLYLGNFRGAASLFEKAVELDDGFAMAHEYLGVAYENLGDNDRAGAESAKAAQLAGRVTVREREKILGDYALFKSDYTKAISHYQVLASLLPQDPAVHLNLAECYINQFRFDAAIAEAKKAADLEPSPGPRENLAVYYFLSGDSQKALDMAQQVLKENPDDTVALYLVGSYYLGVGRSAEADRSWRRLLALGGDAASQARAALADAGLTMDDVKDAIQQLEYGVTVDAEMGNTHELSRKQILLIELRRASGGRQTLTRSLQEIQEPTAPDIMFLLGRLYARLGRRVDAQRELRRLDQWSDKTPRVLLFSDMLQSEIAAADGQFTEAVERAKRGVEHLDCTLAIESLAKAYELDGDREDAAKQYEILLSRANERQFDSVDSPALHAVAAARYRLGVLYQSLGRDDVARQRFSSFLNYAAQSDRTGPLYEDARKRMAQLTSNTGSSADLLPPHTAPPH
jgi:tetratricopeptide (TPR) repeat protein